MCFYDFHGAMIGKAVLFVKSNRRRGWRYRILTPEIAKDIIWPGEKLPVTFDYVQKCYRETNHQDTLDS